VVAELRTHEAHGPLPHVELVATGSVGEIAVLHGRTPGNRVADDHRAEGLHMATQGGLWQAVVLGCAGARALEDGSFRIEPRLPAHWRRLRFRWLHRGTRLTVTVSADELVVEAAEGSATITAPGWSGEVHAGEPLRLSRSAGGWRAAA